MNERKIGSAVPVTRNRFPVHWPPLSSQVLRGIKGSRWTLVGKGRRGRDEFWNLFSSTCHFVASPNFSRTREKKNDGNDNRSIDHLFGWNWNIGVNWDFLFFFLNKIGKFFPKIASRDDSIFLSFFLFNWTSCYIISHLRIISNRCVIYARKSELWFVRF